MLTNNYDFVKQINMFYAGTKSISCTKRSNQVSFTQLNKEDRIVLHKRTDAMFLQWARVRQICWVSFCYVNVGKEPGNLAHIVVAHWKLKFERVKNEKQDYRRLLISRFSPCCEHEKVFIFRWLDGDWKIYFWINSTLILRTVNSTFHPISDTKHT